MKQKVTNQHLRVVEGGPDYLQYMEEARNLKYGRHGARANGDQESIQANPDNLSEASGYWAVSEATKEVQARVRLMLERAKQVLTDRQYNAFVLVDLKKLKLRDAAKVMEINYQRVDQLVKRARLKLQRVYEGTANG